MHITVPAGVEVGKPVDQVVSARTAFDRRDNLQRFQPLSSFQRVDVDQGEGVIHGGPPGKMTG